MDREQVDRLSGVSALQIAAIAIGGSTVAAVATLLGLKRIGLLRRSVDGVTVAPPRPPQAKASESSAPPHFSEDAVLPGLTYTGADILAQDERDGRSPEGV